MTQLTINLDADLLNLPAELLVEQALNHYFDHLDVKLADRRMEDLQNGRSKLIPFEEFLRELNL